MSQVLGSVKIVRGPPRWKILSKYWTLSYKVKTSRISNFYTSATVSLTNPNSSVLSKELLLSSWQITLIQNSASNYLWRSRLNFLNFSSTAPEIYFSKRNSPENLQKMIKDSKKWMSSKKMQKMSFIARSAIRNLVKLWLWEVSLKIINLTRRLKGLGLSTITISPLLIMKG